MAALEFAGEERGTIGGADGGVSRGVDAVEVLCGETIYIWGF